MFTQVTSAGVAAACGTEIGARIEKRSEEADRATSLALALFTWQE